MDDAFSTDPAEISARTGFARNRLVRDGERRDDNSHATALADPRATIHLGCGTKWWVRDPHGRGASAIEAGGAEADATFSLREAADFGVDLGASIVLGYDGGETPVLAARLGEEAGDRGIALVDLRAAATAGALDPDVEGRLGQAQHLLGWHETNGFCARCGSPTRAEAAGYRRRCTACDHIVFPRIDPVTIMLVHDGAGSCILGRQHRFVENMWSCLAGFVEAGETVEDAVRRETAEEAGVTVTRVGYLASQPWAYPGNLMIGCVGLADHTEIRFDTDELEACRWFDRDEVRAMLEKRHPQGLTLPKPVAIAHHLVKAFADGRI